jgi:crossover junction endodeoxyribonuclease RuvC
LTRVAPVPGHGQSGPRVVGFDPGLAATGYAVVERAARGFRSLDMGVIRTDAHLSLETRLLHIFDGVHAVLEAARPDLIAVEDIFSVPAVPRTAIVMGYARAMVCLAGRQRLVEVITVAPAEVKRAVTRSGAASKLQVARAVQALLGLAQVPRPSHVADALALAFTGLSRAQGRAGQTLGPAGLAAAPGRPLRERR